MSTDIEVLHRAYDRENDSRSRSKLWAAYHVGATRADINRLLAEELISQSHQWLKQNKETKYENEDKAGERNQVQRLYRHSTPGLKRT